MATDRKYLLGAVCEVQLGYTARSRLELADAGGIPALQLRDVMQERSASPSVASYRMDAVPDRYWARAGDILFRSRGDRNTATTLGPEFARPAVAVMPLVILRAGPEVDPHYLAWYINQPPAQRHFDECARGTGMRMIPIGCLADLEIPVPDLATQRTLAAIDDLAAREQALSQRLADLRRQHTAITLMRRAQDRYSHKNHRGSQAARLTKERTK